MLKLNAPDEHATTVVILLNCNFFADVLFCLQDSPKSCKFQNPVDYQDGLRHIYSWCYWKACGQQTYLSPKRLWCCQRNLWVKAASNQVQITLQILDETSFPRMSILYVLFSPSTVHTYIRTTRTVTLLHLRTCYGALFNKSNLDGFSRYLGSSQYGRHIFVCFVGLVEVLGNQLSSYAPGKNVIQVACEVSSVLSEVSCLGR